MKGAGGKLMVHLEIRRDAREAIQNAADLLIGWIRDEKVLRLMVAGGNTPLPLYAEVARRGAPVSGLHIEVLDEYVGVPRTDPRTCTNLLRLTVAAAWRVPPERFSGLSSEEPGAETTVIAHERRIEAAGGLDAIVLGLGKNGHLGFNEPGSAEDSRARLLDLDAISIEANRVWFGGEHAPRRGATVGLRTILGSRRVLLLAFGAAKADAVRAMVEGPRTSACPASFLQGHPEAHVFLDEAAGAKLG
jgi:glucosamine-6-phosphate deaminase